MSQENVEIVRRGYESFATGDVEGVADLIADGATLPDAGGLGIADSAAGSRSGPEGFLRAVEEAREAFEDYLVEPKEFIDAGDAVIVPVRISGQGRGSGVKLDIHLVHLWVLRDGKAIRNEIHRTIEEALEAAALQE
jgi:ketosteroid isomerase-like protein